MANINNSENDANATLEISENATKISSITHNNKTCELFDNTASIPVSELTELLNQLVQDRHFGINALSSSDGIILINKPKLSHIQINNDLYRLYLYRYHAIIEHF